MASTVHCPSCKVKIRLLNPRPHRAHVSIFGFSEWGEKHHATEEWGEKHHATESARPRCRGRQSLHYHLRGRRGHEACVTVHTMNAASKCMSKSGSKSSGLWGTHIVPVVSSTPHSRQTRSLFLLFRLIQNEERVVPSFKATLTSNNETIQQDPNWIFEMAGTRFSLWTCMDCILNQV